MTPRAIRAVVAEPRETSVSDPQQRIPPFDFPTDHGDVRITHVGHLTVGILLVDGGARINLLTYDPEAGTGLLMTPTPDEARAIAHQLVEAASALEAAARDQADAALAKAREARS